MLLNSAGTRVHDSRGRNTATVVTTQVATNQGSTCVQGTANANAPCFALKQPVVNTMKLGRLDNTQHTPTPATCPPNQPHTCLEPPEACDVAQLRGDGADDAVVLKLDL